MKHINLVHAALVLMLAGSTAQPAVPLAGECRFHLDRADAGITERWFERALPDTFKLPGALPASGIGDAVTVDTPWTGGIVDKSFFTAPEWEKYRQPGNVKVPFWLQPEKYYAGAAWFQRDIEIPKDWEGKRVVLFLERAHWETRVWVDRRLVGTNNSLSTPHEYELGMVGPVSHPASAQGQEEDRRDAHPGLAPGRHTLTIRVDNRRIVDIGENSHGITDHTQGNWNGIVGKIELRVTPLVWMDDLQVQPDVPGRYRLVVSVTQSSPAREDPTLPSANDWDIWVYPAPSTTAPPKDILVTAQFDDAAREHVASGGKLLLTLPGKVVRNFDTAPVKLGSSSIFWNTAWTGRQAPTTLGILCDPEHPALAEFPTDFHSNWLLSPD